MIVISLLYLASVRSLARCLFSIIARCARVCRCRCRFGSADDVLVSVFGDACAGQRPRDVRPAIYDHAPSRRVHLRHCGDAEHARGGRREGGFSLGFSVAVCVVVVLCIVVVVIIVLPTFTRQVGLTAMSYLLIPYCLSDWTRRSKYGKTPSQKSAPKTDAHHNKSFNGYL